MYDSLLIARIQDNILFLFNIITSFVIKRKIYIGYRLKSLGQFLVVHRIVSVCDENGIYERKLASSTKGASYGDESRLEMG